LLGDSSCWIFWRATGREGRAKRDLDRSFEERLRALERLLVQRNAEETEREKQRRVMRLGLEIASASAVAAPVVAAPASVAAALWKGEVRIPQK
jgi:hypothetical protein